MIADAIKLAKQGKPHYIEVQGAQYEGLTVWFNSLVASAGGQILSGPRDGRDRRLRAVKAAAIIPELANSPAADPGLSNSNEDAARLGFESGKAAFEVNYPFVYPSIQADKPKLAKQFGWTYYPRVDAGTPGQGHDRRAQPRRLGLLASTPSTTSRRSQCLTDARQPEGGRDQGRPRRPTLASLYSDPALAKPYPFKALIKQELAKPAIRPQTPAYADVTIAIQKALSPPGRDQLPRRSSTRCESELKSALSSGALI